MATTSRRLSAKANKASRTPGKLKGASCNKSPLKTWGMNANPYKLKGGDLERYSKYCQETWAMNYGAKKTT